MPPRDFPDRNPGSGVQAGASPASRWPRFLPVVLSLVAGSVDAASFLGLGLFSAHVTGNLVVLTAHIAARKLDVTYLVLSVPTFILVLGLTRLLVAGLEARNIRPLRPLLLLQFLILGMALVLVLASGDRPSPEDRRLFCAGQLSIAAMAVQNALVQLSLHGSPTTAVMTTNVTRFIMDAGEVLLGRNPAEVIEARHRAKHTWPVILGFIAGAALGAACFSAIGLKSFALPTGLALIALVMSPTAQSSTSVVQRSLC